jgi:hypothetical protein
MKACLDWDVDFAFLQGSTAGDFRLQHQDSPISHPSAWADDKPQYRIGSQTEPRAGPSRGISAARLCGQKEEWPPHSDSPESTDCPRPLAQDDDRHRAGHPVRARRPDDAGQHRQLVRDCQSGRRPRAGSHPGVRRGPLSGVDLWRQRVGPNPPLVTHPGRRAKKHGAMQLGVTSQNGSLLGIWRGRP